MRDRIIKNAAILIINTTSVLLFWFYLETSAFALLLFLLALLNSILIKKQNTSSSLFTSYLKKQYYKTKFRILNNLDNKSGIKKFAIAKINKIYQKILFYLILIFKTTEAGYQVVREDIFSVDSLLATKIRSEKQDDVVDALGIAKKIKNKECVSWNELEKLDRVLLSLYKQKQQKFTRFSAGTIYLLIIATSTTSLISSLIFSGVSNLKAATYGWVQTDWTGGADTVTTASHTDDQANWTKFYSKDNNVDTATAGELTISSAQVAITDTTDADFNATTKTNNSGGFYITDGTIHLKKQIGASCTVSDECNGACIGGNCQRYQTGPCAGIEVLSTDTLEVHQWKIVNTACSSPQCLFNYLIIDNAADFSEYPARNVCKDLEGRLPTETELSCIYNNKESYGNNFVEGSYVSSYYSGYQSMLGWHTARILNFANGSENNMIVTANANVRCVRNL